MSRETDRECGCVGEEVVSTLAGDVIRRWVPHEPGCPLQAYLVRVTYEFPRPRSADHPDDLDSLLTLVAGAAGRLSRLAELIAEFGPDEGVARWVDEVAGEKSG